MKIKINIYRSDGVLYESREVRFDQEEETSWQELMMMSVEERQLLIRTISRDQANFSVNNIE